MEIKLPMNSGIRQQDKDISQHSAKMRTQSGEKSRRQFRISREKFGGERQNPSCESPTSIRLNKNVSKIVEQPITTSQQISTTHNQIDLLIDQLDFKLQAHYHAKENSLIESYRAQLIKAHKDLMDLKNNSNEQQIKNEMNQKFLQLKKERLQLIQVNMFYSNKCLEYKKLLDEKLGEGQQLEREIKFLQKQINNSNQKRIDLMSKVYEENSPLKNYKEQQDDEGEGSRQIISLQNIKISTDRKQQQASNPFQSLNKKTSFSTHANTEVMRKLGLTSSSKSKIKINPNKIPELNNQVKKLFQEKLIGQQNFYTNRSSAKSGTILTKISALQQPNENSSSIKVQQKKQTSEIQILFMKAVNELKEKKGSRKQISLFKSEQFTDLQKREIMKAFLAKEDVKQYIYNIIFDKTDDMALFKKKSFKEKFKIVASGRKDEDQVD